ncbi:MAG: hypothetical protein ABIK92_00680 [Pseudomonadota bacterium]
MRKFHPQEDIRRLSEKYGLSASGLSNISRYFIGPEIQQWVDRGLYWKQRLEPFINKKDGDKKEKIEDVKPSAENETMPDFLIRLSNVSVNLPMGEFSGKIKDISSDQKILGLPITFDFSGDKLSGVNSVKLDGSVNRIKPDFPSDKFNLQLKNYKIKAASISKSSSLPLTFEKGNADMDLEAILKKGIIDAAVKLNLNDVSMLSGDVSSGYAKAVSSALKGVSKIDIKADIKGPVDNYKINISSNLDGLLKNAIGSAVKEQAALFQNKLRAGISDKVKGPVQEAKGSLAGFEGLESEIENRLSQLTGMQAGSAEKNTGIGGFKLPLF